MIVLNNFDTLNILLNFENNEDTATPLSNRCKYAVFIRPNEFKKNNWDKLGFVINKSKQWFDELDAELLNKILFSDRIIRIYSNDNDKVKTLLYIVTGYFYEKRIGLKLYNEEKQCQ